VQSHGSDDRDELLGIVWSSAWSATVSFGVSVAFGGGHGGDSAWVSSRILAGYGKLAIGWR